MRKYKILEKHLNMQQKLDCKYHYLEEEIFIMICNVDKKQLLGASQKAALDKSMQ